MGILEWDAFRLAPDAKYPLFLTAKRYRPKQEAELTAKGKERENKRDEGSVDAMTLIVLHSTSFHKETWEPSLETLFNLQRQSDKRTTTLNACRPWIEEAWVIEAPNHGESALLNRRAFLAPPFATRFGCDGYSKAVYRFLTKGPVPFSNRKLIGIGHSLGANTMLLLQDRIHDDDNLHFASLILVDPLVNPLGGHHLDPLRDRLVATANKRDDTWATRDDVKRFLRGRGKGRGKWDERVIDAFSKFGVHPIGQPGRDQKVTLACTREQEVAMYLDSRGSTAPVEVLNRVSPRIPIHLVLGLVKDFIPLKVHDALTDPASGRIYASITNLPGVGHLVPQEAPDTLAEVIHRALIQSCTQKQRYRTKL